MSDKKYFEQLLEGLEFMKTSSRTPRTVEAYSGDATPWSSIKQQKVNNVVSSQYNKLKGAIQQLQALRAKPEPNAINAIAQQLVAIGTALENANDWYRQDYVQLTRPDDWTSMDADDLMQEYAELLTSSADDPETAQQNIDWVSKALQRNLSELASKIKELSGRDVEKKKEEEKGKSQAFPGRTLDEKGQTAVWNTMQSKVKELKDRGITDPLEIRKQILQDLDKMFKKSSLDKLIRTADNSVLQKEHAKRLLDNYEMFAPLLTTNGIQAPDISKEQWKAYIQPAKAQQPEQQKQQTQQQAPTSAPATKPTAGEVVHTVLPGETLSGIAKSRLKDMGRWKEILQLNPEIKDPNKIYEGQKLKLPGDAAPAPTTPAPKQKTKKDIKPAPVKQEAPKQEAPKQEPAKQEAPKQEPAKQEETPKEEKKPSDNLSPQYRARKQFLDRQKESISTDSKYLEKDPNNPVVVDRYLERLRQYEKSGDVQLYTQALKALPEDFDQFDEKLQPNKFLGNFHKSRVGAYTASRDNYKTYYQQLNLDMQWLHELIKTLEQRDVDTTVARTYLRALEIYKKNGGQISMSDAYSRAKQE